MKLYETSQNVCMRTLVVRTGIGSRNSKKLFVSMREPMQNFAKHAKFREIILVRSCFKVEPSLIHIYKLRSKLK